MAGSGGGPGPCREPEKETTAMNSHGKSDKPVVPLKPADAGPIRSFWELLGLAKRVEGRGLAKENGEDASLPQPVKQNRPIGHRAA